MEDYTSVFHMDAQQMDLPPGFRFYPTDQELILEYLFPKAHTSTFSPVAITEVDLNKCEPWDLPKMAKIGEKQWYFYSMRDKKYPTGPRMNRSTGEGYWKATGKDKEIYSGELLVGMKKTLVFYKGRARKGEKSKWIMHEYRLDDKWCIQNLPFSKNEWVVCRVFQKGNASGTKMPEVEDHQTLTMNPTEPVQTQYCSSSMNNNTTGLRQQVDFQGLDATNYMNSDSFNQLPPAISDYNSQLQTSLKPNPEYTFGSFSDQTMPSSSFFDIEAGEGMPMNHMVFSHQEEPSSSFGELDIDHFIRDCCN